MVIFKERKKDWGLVDFWLEKDIPPYFLEQVQEGSGTPYEVSMSLERFVGDAQEGLINKAKRLAKKLRKEYGYTQCIITDLQTAKADPKTSKRGFLGLQQNSCSLTATFYRHRNGLGYQQWRAK